MKTVGPAVFGICLILALAVVVLRAAGRSGGRPEVEKRGFSRTITVKTDTGKVIYSQSGHDVTPLGEKRVNELAADLTPDERHILLGKGTERPFCGKLLDIEKRGVYVCRLCGLPLFASQTKFHSGTGWPSFFQPIDPAHIREHRDTSHGMVRIETICARCGSHLGHVFNDGPAPTRLRYCMNSGSLRFYAADDKLPPESKPAAETAYFAGGCFWGIEDHFQKVPGVIDAVSGYQGGATSQPSYEQVSTGMTGHAETVRVLFDPKRIKYEKLLEWFFKLHDPTQVNRQGPDMGTQYRSAIFAANDDQLKQAKAYIDELSKSNRFRGRRIATVVEPAKPFFEAEAYHQNYHVRHGGSCPLPVLPRD